MSGEVRLLREGECADTVGTTICSNLSFFSVIIPKPTPLNFIRGSCFLHIEIMHGAE